MDFGWFANGAELSTAACVACEERKAAVGNSERSKECMLRGPYQGCDAYRSLMGQYASDRYLSEAFEAGMVEGTSGNGTIVDGGEEYDNRTIDEFNTSRSWRKGLTTPGRGSIANLDPKSKCPFMDAGIATGWSQKLSIASGTYDRQRPSRSSNQWTPITDVAIFRKTLTNALRATDEYVGTTRLGRTGGAPRRKTR